MGLIGLLLTVVIMVLGAGYYFFGMSPSSLTVINDAPAPVAQGVALSEEMKTQANAIKDAVEAKARTDMTVLNNISQPSVPPVNPAPKKEETGPAIIDRLMTSGFAVSKKTRAIDTIVLHSSYDPNGSDPYSVSALVKIYESYGVSAHYLIDRAGRIYRLVADKNIAYHAGVSRMADGRKDVNDFSIGIEIMNQEDTEYTQEQYAAVNGLVAALKKQYTIKYVVGHGDIAPDRKTDPWNFDWKRLR